MAVSTYKRFDSSLLFSVDDLIAESEAAAAAEEAAESLAVATVKEVAPVPQESIMAVRTCAAASPSPRRRIATLSSTGERLPAWIDRLPPIPARRASGNVERPKGIRGWIWDLITWFWGI